VVDRQRLVRSQLAQGKGIVVIEAIIVKKEIGVIFLEI